MERIGSDDDYKVSRIGLWPIVSTVLSISGKSYEYAFVGLNFHFGFPATVILLISFNDNGETHTTSKNLASARIKGVDFSCKNDKTQSGLMLLKHVMVLLTV